jgi:hypothetical protein
MANDQAPGLPAPPTPTLPESKGEALQSGFAQFLKAGTGQQYQGSDIEAAIKKHYDQRVEEARMNAESASRAWAILHDPNGIDPETGKPLDDAGRQKYQNRFDTAYAAYNKAAGVSKESKGIIAQGKAVLDHFSKRVQQQRAQGAGGQGGGMPPPPQASAAAPPEPGSGMLPGGIPAPPQPTPAPASKPWTPADEAIKGPMESRFVAENEGTQSALRQRSIVAKVAGITPESPEYKEFIATGKFPTSYGKPGTSNMYTDRDGTPFMGREDADGMVTNNETGERVPGALKATPGAFTPKRFNYTGADGKPQVGYQVGRKFYSLDGKELPMGTEAFSAWMQPRFTESHTLKVVKMKDGSEALVPVDTESVTTRGTPNTGPAASPQTPPPSSKGPSKSSSSSGHAHTGGTGSGPTPRVIPGSGTAPPGVAKAYESYNAAKERFDVMMEALPDAEKGDQQAELNLLANHIGMTMGLQKGSRITQAIYNEAAESAPWLQRVEAHFDKDGYLTGVVLTPEQMQQMIKLAKVRLQKDREAWQREIAASKTGYTSEGTDAPTDLKKNGPPAKTPTTADEYLQGLTSASPK